MKKILVIDDNQPILEIIKIVLEEHNYKAFVTNNGFEGISIAKANHVDLIICDLNMPLIGGLNVLERIRQDPETATIPFIFLTGDGDMKNLRAGMNLGADDYLNKPVIMNELITSIQKRLEKSEIFHKNNQEKFENLSRNISYVLPHEFNTPLFAILGCSEIIMDITDNPQVKELSELIFSSSRRLEKLIKKFIIFSQVELLRTDKKKQKSLNRMIVDNPQEIIENIWKDLDSERKDDIFLKVSKTKLQASIENFCQVVQEIIDNAIKFSDKNSKIEIKSEENENYFILSITDHGVGMTPQQIANIGPYSQFDRKVYEQQGMGLGLIIAKTLTEIHEGIFEISSEKDIFTTITLKFKKV
jgi:two-component system sensor histidine kinase/response regulator